MQLAPALATTMKTTARGLLMRPPAERLPELLSRALATAVKPFSHRERRLYAGIDAWHAVRARMNAPWEIAARASQLGIAVDDTGIKTATAYVTSLAETLSETGERSTSGIAGGRRRLMAVGL